MTEIEIKETGKLEQITVIDPRTGTDWSGDLIGNGVPVIQGYNDDGCMIMDQKTFDWWSNYCTAYQEADDIVQKFFDDLDTEYQKLFDEDPDLQEDAYVKTEKMQGYYYNFIGGIEFNNVPGAMIKFVEENK